MQTPAWNKQNLAVCVVNPTIFGIPDSCIAKDEAQRERVEGFLRALRAATLWLMSDHGARLRQELIPKYVEIHMSKF